MELQVDRSAVRPDSVDVAYWCSGVFDVAADTEPGAHSRATDPDETGEGKSKPGYGRTIGAALRSRRQALGLTMQAVADAAGLSVGFISQAERGLAAPSLNSLADIARVLRVPVAGLLDQTQPPIAAPPVGAGIRPRLRMRMGDVVFERLTRSLPGGQLRAVVIHEPPGRRTPPTQHDGEEMIYVLAGAFTTEIEGVPTVLESGEAIHFDSRRTHATWNHTDRTTVLLWCGTADIFGEEPPDPIHRADGFDTAFPDSR